MKTQEQIISEQATGCRQQGQLTLYDEDGQKVSKRQARKNIREGKPIAIPGAGAGNYRKVFCEILGFKSIEVLNWSSSAGDWQFGVNDGIGWRLACQDNRYPYHGFLYSVAQEGEIYWGFSTFEDLANFQY